MVDGDKHLKPSTENHTIYFVQFVLSRELNVRCQ